MLLAPISHVTVQGLKARHKSQAKILPNPYLLSCRSLVTMSSPINDHEFLSELPALSHNTNVTFWIPLCPAIPKWVPYRIIPQNIQVLPKHPASQSPEDRKALHKLCTIYKLEVEGANLDADIENRRLLEEYRADLAKWRKKRAAVCRMQLRLPNALMGQILELMKQRSATLGNELQQRRAAGMLHDALTLHTDEWEAETDKLINALFLQLNNELACELSDKRRRIKSAVSGSGQSGQVEIRDVESLKGAAKKVGVNKA